MPAWFAARFDSFGCRYQLRRVPKAVSRIRILTITDQVVKAFPSNQIRGEIRVAIQSTVSDDASMTLQNFDRYGLPTMSSIVLKSPTSPPSR